MVSEQANRGQSGSARWDVPLATFQPSIEKEPLQRMIIGTRGSQRHKLGRGIRGQIKGRSAAHRLLPPRRLTGTTLLGTQLSYFSRTRRVPGSL
jgi:hypothetical protein